MDYLCALVVEPITGLPDHFGVQGENEGVADRNILRCLRRHVANEVFAFLTHVSTEPLPGSSLRRRRQALGIRLTATALGVPYQWLWRLKPGTPTAPDLVHPGQHWLD